MLSEKINNMTITEEKIVKILRNIQTNIEKLSQEKNPLKQIKLIDKISEERNHYLTLYWSSYIGYLKNIKDKKYLESETLIANYDGKYNNLIYKMYEILDSIEEKDSLIKKYGKRFFNIAHNQKILLANNDELFQKEKTLRKEYRSILNSPRIDFNGEEISLIKLSKYLQDENYIVRKEAYDKRYAALLKINEELECIFKKLLKVRANIAISSNFKNYADYSYIKMNRIDYNQDELETFKKNIVKYFVPLREKLKEAQTKRLEEKNLSYYNETILFKDGNAKNDYNLSEILVKIDEILFKINPEYKNVFQDLQVTGMIDLEERENKSAGGIATYLPDYKTPTFIKRFINNSTNFITLTHEFGHCLQLYFNKEKNLHENRWPTFDICEIHSTTMELLISNYADIVYKNDTPKHLITHFTNIINLLIRTSAVDDFQTKIYSTTNDIDINKAWNEIYKKYYPTNNYDLEYFKKGILWQSDINRIDDPFYGIDYALATIYALSFYKKYNHNKDTAIEEFTNFCKDGGEIAFKEISTKYNLFSPFNEENLKELAEFLDSKISSIIKDLK